MKALVFALSIFVASTITTTAQAIVHLPGTFVASKCGLQEYNIIEGRNVQSICIGSVVGEEAGTQTLVFQLNDSTERRFKVAESASLFIAFASGNVKSKFFLVDVVSGEEVTVNVIQSADGDVLAVSGTLEGIDFLVPQFETVLGIQSFGAFSL